MFPLHAISIIYHFERVTKTNQSICYQSSVNKESYRPKLVFTFNYVAFLHLLCHMEKKTLRCTLENSYKCESIKKYIKTLWNISTNDTPQDPMSHVLFGAGINNKLNYTCFLQIKINKIL